MERAMIEQEQHGDVAIVRMAHGRASAMDLEFCVALTKCFEELADGRGPVVLTGTGSIFSAGVDLKRLVAEGREYTAAFFDALAPTFETLWMLDRPVVAAVNGHAIAGGCVLAQACDTRLMASGKGRIGLPELVVGVPFPPLVLEMMRATLSNASFRDITLRGRNYTAEDALRLGLVDEIVEPDALLDRACKAAESMGRAPANAFAFVKQQVRARTRDWMARGGLEATEACKQLWLSDEVRDAIARYVEQTLN